MATPCARHRSTDSRIVAASPACAPQAMLAELMCGTMAASWPQPSPRSQLKSSDGNAKPQPPLEAGVAIVEGAAGCAASAAGAVHNFASGAPPSICARTSGIGGPP